MESNKMVRGGWRGNTYRIKHLAKENLGITNEIQSWFKKWVVGGHWYFEHFNNF